ncbi:uncharacterized protein LOC144448088 [Glandiceps talaboti]
MDYSTVAVFISVLLYNKVTIEVLSSDIVRLVDGPIPEIGIVEVNVPDHGWIQICADDYWNSDTADVVCTSLGYPGAMVAGITDVENKVEGQEWVTLYNLTCTGDRKETPLNVCSYEIAEQCTKAARPRCNYKGYMGCYFDNPFNKRPDVGPIENDTMTIQYCLNWCRGQDMAYAELSLGRACSCRREGNDYTNIVQTDGCDAVCEGDESSICGGIRKFGVYPTTIGACGGSIREGGIIYSPGFPGNYTDMMDCTWDIAVSHGSIVSLNFVLLNLAGENDYINVIETKSGITENLRHFNRISSDTKIALCSNIVTITFHSDMLMNINDGVGMFEVEVSAETLSCEPPTIEHGTFTINGTCPSNISIHVNCDEGFQLTSSYSSVICKEDRQWNSSFPTCEKVSDANGLGRKLGIGNKGTLIIIIGVVAVVLLIIAAVLLFAILYLRRRKLQAQRDNHFEMETIDHDHIDNTGIQTQTMDGCQYEEIQAGVPKEGHIVKNSSAGEYATIVEDMSDDGNTNGQRGVAQPSHYAVTNIVQTEQADVPEVGDQEETNGNLPMYTKPIKKGKRKREAKEEARDENEYAIGVYCPGSNDSSHPMVDNIAYESFEG